MCALKSPPHTSRFFVVGLRIFCRGQIGLKFIGPSACRTLADFLSRLTALRLGVESSKIKMAPIPLTRRKLKLALFTFTFLRRIKRRRKSSTRTTWVKSWITRRNEQGVSNNLLQELGNEDPTGFRWYFRLSKENFQQILVLLSFFTGVYCSISALISASTSAMLEKTLVHVTLMTFPNWFRRARAPTNCLGPPHTSRQGPTRRFEI